jgi:RNA polymerase sigma-70 factor, ECF subfamily
MDEREAVDRLKRGEVGALEALVRRYHARAGRTAFLILRDHALAEDVAQEAFVRAYKGIGRFDSGRPFGPWFMRIVVNEAVGAARGRERTASYEGGDAGAPVEWLADPAAGPHELAEEAEQRRRVWVALAKLPPAQRAVVVQRYYLGMSEAEMAESGDIRRELSSRACTPREEGSRSSFAPRRASSPRRGREIVGLARAMRRPVHHYTHRRRKARERAEEAPGEGAAWVRRRVDAQDHGPLARDQRAGGRDHYERH